MDGMICFIALRMAFVSISMGFHGFHWILQDMPWVSHESKCDCSFWHQSVCMGLHGISLFMDFSRGFIDVDLVCKDSSCICMGFFSIALIYFAWISTVRCQFLWFPWAPLGTRLTRIGFLATRFVANFCVSLKRWLNRYSAVPRGNNMMWGSLDPRCEFPHTVAIRAFGRPP